MKKLTLMVSVFLSVAANSQDAAAKAKKQALCEKEKNEIHELNKAIQDNSNEISDLNKHLTYAKIDTPSAKIKEIIALSHVRLDARINLMLVTLEKERRDAERRQVEENSELDLQIRYHEAALDLLNEVKTRKLAYENVAVSDIKNNSYKKLIAYYNSQIRQLEKYNKMIQIDIDAKEEKISKMACYLFNEPEKDNEEEFIKKIIGGWKDQPTPWGTPGGPCQIKYVNGKLMLINEDKNESGATISINSDGSATISASKWPVTGEVDKSLKTIKWSNGSVWTR